MERFYQIMRMINTNLSIRGTAPEDVFEDVDKYRSGLISYDSFNRVLNSYGIRLESKDFQELIANLSENGRISCQKFISKMREIMKESQENKEPSSCSKNNFAGIEPALAELKSFLSIHQTSIREVLRPYDRPNRGVVSINDFIRAFALSPSIQARLIAENFKDNFTNEVRYFEIDRILSQINTSRTSNPNQTQEIPPLIEQIISQIVSKNIIDIRQYFEQYDRIRNGYVSKRSFPMIIENAANIRLNSNELMQVFKTYGYQEYVKYIPFVNEIEERIRKNQINPNHTYVNKNGKSIDTDFLIQEMKKLFYARRVNVSTLFPYAVDGKCNRYKFLKTLNVEQKQLNADELSAIADRYDIGNNTIDLDSFVSNFDVFGRTRNSNMTNSNLITHSQISIEKVIEHIKQYLLSHQICLQVECELFDYLKTGRITLSQLLAAVQRCCIYINEDEFNAVVSHYEVEKGSIDYLRLCSDVDNPDILVQQRNQKRQELAQRRSPRRNVESSTTASDFVANRKLNTSSDIFAHSNNPVTPSQTVQRELKPPPIQTLRIVAKIAEITRNRGIFLRDEFTDKDKCKRGTVSQDDFMRVMSLTSPTAQIPNREMAEVYLYYSQNSNFFDYRSFCRDIEGCIRETKKEQKAEPVSTAEVPNNSIDYNEYYSLNMNNAESPEFLKTIRKFKAFLCSRMLQTDDVFRSYDQNGSGYIKSANLAPALLASNIEMSPREIQILLDNFSDRIIEDRFMYRKLEARADKEKINTYDIRMLLNPEYALEEERRQFHCALSEVREKLHARKRNAFIVFGALKSSTITPEEFNNKLLDFGIVLVPSQVEALAKRYTNGDMKNFDWQSFCNDCEKCMITSTYEFH